MAFKHSVLHATTSSAASLHFFPCKPSFSFAHRLHRLYIPTFGIEVNVLFLSARAHRRAHPGKHFPSSELYPSNLSPMSKEFTPAEVAQNKSEKSMMLIIDGSVYDVTSFIDEHPGGPKILKRMAGKDASKAFWKYHGESVLEKYGPKMKVGTVKEAAKL